MIDVFVRSMSKLSPLREAFYHATLARWDLDPLANVTYLADIGIRETRLLAESLAKTDPYIFSDDDVLPHGKNWIETGTRILLAHPEYAIASTRSLIEVENQATGPGDIFEVRAVGAPMWIRKGILKDDLPEFLFVEECIALDNYVRAKGYKEGLMNGIRHLHIGTGFSTTPQYVTGY